MRAWWSALPRPIRVQACACVKPAAVCGRPCGATAASWARLIAAFTSRSSARGHPPHTSWYGQTARGRVDGSRSPSSFSMTRTTGTTATDQLGAVPGGLVGQRVAQLTARRIRHALGPAPVVAHARDVEILGHDRRAALRQRSGHLVKKLLAQVRDPSMDSPEPISRLGSSTRTSPLAYRLPLPRVSLPGSGRPGHHGRGTSPHPELRRGSGWGPPMTIILVRSERPTPRRNCSCSAATTTAPCRYATSSPTAITPASSRRTTPVGTAAGSPSA